MKNIYFLIAFFILCMSCQQEEEMIQPDENGRTDAVTETPVLKGHVRVKLKAGVQQRLNVVKTRSGVSSGITALDLANVDLSVYRMERVFPVAGKFEERHREAGLDLWYDVYFDEKVHTRSAVATLGNVPEVEYVEEVREARLLDYRKMPDPLQRMGRPVTRAEGTEEMPFNDTYLPNMWHYHNAGEEANGLSGALEGADIGLFEAWKTETGSSNVIVAVMDGGIQYDHPDLAANMWVNEAELNGQDGADDDNNGYTDDIYGWNFVTARNVPGPGNDSIRGNGAVTPYEHGTHCAGTISAVNGNGIGVCGIAGGSGNGDGVRLMSCQIFHTDPATGVSQAYADPNMYVYAADMGAVISSNSWTNGAYEESAFLNSALRSAIDYFIRYAGTDVSTKRQNGPMKGGLVVFAAANNNSDVKEWPAAYPGCLAVAAMAHNFKRASYSNFGEWVDITAPGGEQSYGDNYAILSTTINGQYTWLQGTSMACPHVSGCAALVLSKFQGEGYTPDELTGRLTNATHSLDAYNQKFKGLLGAGYIDVGLALTPPSLVAPEISELTLVDAYDDWAIVEWEVKEASDGPMSKYVISWSTSPVRTAVSEALTGSKTVNVRYVKAGTVMRDTIRGLVLGQTYHFTLQAYDRWGGVSEEAPQQSCTVVENLRPELFPAWNGMVMLDEGTERTLMLKVSEPEKQRIACRMAQDLPWVRTENIGDSVVYIRIAPDYTAAGVYRDQQILVSDQYGKESVLDIPMEVFYREVSPRIARNFEKLQLPADGRRTTLKLDEYFSDPKGRTLIYEVENTADAIARVQRNGEMLTIEPCRTGRAEVLVRAKNEAGLSVSQRFMVEVVQGNAGDLQEALTVFPNPVKTRVQISLQPAARGEVTVRLYNAAGRMLKLEQVNIGDSGYSLEMDGMQAGAYVLVVEGPAGSWKKNIIKI